MLLPQRNFYIQAITRLPSRRSKRITVARQSRNLTSLPLVTLVAVVLFYKLTQSISQKIHGFNTFFHFKSRLFLSCRKYRQKYLVKRLPCMAGMGAKEPQVSFHTLLSLDTVICRKACLKRENYLSAPHSFSNKYLR